MTIYYPAESKDFIEFIKDEKNKDFIALLTPYISKMAFAGKQKAFTDKYWKSVFKKFFDSDEYKKLEYENTVDAKFDIISEGQNIKVLLRVEKPEDKKAIIFYYDIYSDGMLRGRNK